MAQGIPTRLTPVEGRRFAWTLGAAFAVLGGLAAWRGHVRIALAALALAAVLLLAGLLVPGRLGPLYRAWMGLAVALSRVTTPVFLAVLYFAVLTPGGVLVRWFRGNPLRRPAAAPSFWVTRPEGTRRRRDMNRWF